MTPSYTFVGTTIQQQLFDLKSAYPTSNSNKTQMAHHDMASNMLQDNNNI